jgi:hypothetical protein
MTRKVIQLQVSQGRSTDVWVLCDDGTVWRNAVNPDGSVKWIRVDTSTLEQAP